ncbi:glycosyltransferase family 39 protein [Ferdinandcohnia sp. Marseille-Q9671]
MTEKLEHQKLHSILNKKNIIFFILLIGFFLRAYALYKYGLNLSLNSDDAGYTRSAMVLLEKFMLIYHDPNAPTVHIMPGQTFLLAVVFFIFGQGDLGIYAAKFVMIMLGLSSIYGIYLIGKQILSENAGLIAAFLLAIFIPQILTDNLLLTESPFTAFSIYMIYFSLKLAESKKMTDFYLLMLFYFLAIYFRPTIALYPFILLVYLLLKKYPLKLAVKQFSIAFVLLLLILGPWWIRNYMHFDTFIPLTGGSGNPLLLGTFQGIGFPYDETYDDIVDKVNNAHPNADAYEIMKYQEEIAKDRLAEWWSTDKKSFIYTFAVLKPKILWETQFYWIEIFGVKGEWIQKVNPFILLASLAGMLISFLLSRSRWKEFLFLGLFLLYFTYINSFYFAYDRYNLPLMPLIFLFIGFGISSIGSRRKTGQDRII